MHFSASSGKHSKTFKTLSPCGGGPGGGEARQWGVGGEGAPDECSEIIPRARHRAGSFE